VSRQLGPREHEDLAHVPLADQVGEQGLLPVAIDRVDQLAHVLGRGVARRDLDGRRVAQERLREVADLLREGRREQQVLAAARQELEDPPNVREEAHVEHPVRLVEHQDLDAPEVDRPLADMVEQPTGRRDQDLHARAEGLDLRFDRDAAIDHGRAQRNGPPVGPDTGVDLHRELAGRHEDQHPDRVARRREAGVGVLPHPIEDREHECGGLARSGLGCREEVATLEDEWDGACLDRRRGVIALFGDGREKIGRQAERVKCQERLLRVPPLARAGATVARCRAARSIAQMARIEAVSAGTPAIELLRRAGIEHRVHAYSPAERHGRARDDRPNYGREAATALDVDPDRIYKTLVASVDDGLVLAVVRWPPSWT
jgi:hypothetical protein